ncbi:rod shape-determining protein MreD [Synechococcus sp. LTW-G]
MAGLHRHGPCVASALSVPALTLLSPGWLSLDGISPSWAVLWLLPWALVDGAWSGASAGLALGLLLDGLHVGHVTQLPALVLLGWWWGLLGRRGSPIERSFNLGLLAALGSLVLGGSFLLQWRFQGVLPEGGLQLLAAQALITALLAPLVCSVLLLRWRQLLSARG